ncbi:stage VI sporulation protein F [Brevibacillus laterosporus]|uniref:stage VI sporulation protein F n=1 Tax=Brevibacillus laterosporus TaxID=1465 RepID=UPI002652C43C|nr:stage VI sporulation protein F [Brevibacillus laterosporus]MDN9008862.1 stage VI sporulation protein F [Brevibacillus laterosporus]MDO0940969.1 stage VI sporulation protein F [Brevibacillus laterosporus]
MNKRLSRSLLNKLTGKTNIDQSQLFQLASSFNKEDLQDDQKLRQLIQMVSVMSGVAISSDKEEEIMGMVQNGSFNPDDLSGMLDKMK